jgi:hypothetical protein
MFGHSFENSKNSQYHSYYHDTLAGLRKRGHQMKQRNYYFEQEYKRKCHEYKRRSEEYQRRREQRLDQLNERMQQVVLDPFGIIFKGRVKE